MFIYKIYFDDVEDFYIGSTVNITKRKYEHKTRCKNNVKNCNDKLYDFIRENNLLDKIKYEILYSNFVITKKGLLIKETEYMKELNPTLNAIKSYLTEKEKKEYACISTRKTRAKLSSEKKKEIYKKDYEKRSKKYTCICGKILTIGKKSRHEKTNYHLKRINSCTD